MITLRPHHLLCMQFFVGKGYNEDFVRNMTDVIERLKDEPAVLTLSSDSVCKSCPNLHSGLCRTQDKVQLYDQRLLSLLHLSEGDTIYFSDCAQTLRSMDLSSVLSEVCNDCEWQDICQSQI